MAGGYRLLRIWPESLPQTEPDVSLPHPCCSLVISLQGIGLCSLSDLFVYS